MTNIFEYIQQRNNYIGFEKYGQKTESNNISLMYSDFEQIKKLEEDGQEYWTSRELCNALGYSTYQKFTRILNKAIAVANGKGMKIAYHFNQTVEMVELGSGTICKVENMYL